MYLMAVQACAGGGQWERALSLMVERRVAVAREAKEEAALEGEISSIAQVVVAALWWCNCPPPLAFPLPPSSPF